MRDWRSYTFGVATIREAHASSNVRTHAGHAALTEWNAREKDYFSCAETRRRAGEREREREGGGGGQ